MVFKKLEQQISGKIVSTTRNARLPRLEIEPNSSEKITNGRQNTKPSLMHKLTAYRKAFTVVGTKFPHSNGNSSAPKKIRNEAWFLYLRNMKIKKRRKEAGINYRSAVDVVVVVVVSKEYVVA